MFNTPIVLIIFRRPEFTRRVAEIVATLDPKTLFVIADGPRADRPDEAALCARTRAVIDEFKWNGTVIKHYSDVNLGCGRRPATGIDWVFSQVDEAIILEDDCVPHPSFFRYCEEMLERYRDDERIMHIAGTTFRREPLPISYSYTFSQMNAAWGWATWRRAWRHFDFNVALWPELRGTSWLSEVLPDSRVEKFWADSFDRAYAPQGNLSYWDHQWAFAVWANNGLAVVPRRNLITNIGCNRDGTHCADENDIVGNLPAHQIEFPLRHPPTVLHNRSLDREFVRNVIAPRLFPPPPPVTTRIRKRARRILGQVKSLLGPSISIQAFARHPAPHE